MPLRISEIYRSKQGEGLLTGTPSVFVRVSGCNLRCGFCDTPYTSWAPEGETMKLDDLFERVVALETRHVVLTGGEPMLFDAIVEFCARLRDSDFHLTIETAGTVDQPVACDLMSISPKLSNSTPSVELAGAWRDRHERTRDAPQVIERLVRDYAYQLKFVIATLDDCHEVQNWLTRFPAVQRERVLLMPEGTDPQRLEQIGHWLQPYCDEHGLRFCPRRHIEWYGARRGT